MPPRAYYNEFDKGAAAWTHELMKAGVITEGEVDERSIEDVAPDDLRGYGRCHFFAGIAVWDYALQLAGFPADRNVWTGSCPCQSFSTAGKRKGFADERHLWPAWFHLIGQCRPELLFGEQVDSSDAHAWLDLVHADLEAIGYTVGAVVTPAAGFGAPHGRHRIYWCAVADHQRERRGRWPHEQEPGGEDAAERNQEANQLERRRGTRRVRFEFDERSLEPLDRLVEQGRLKPEDRELFRLLEHAKCNGGRSGGPGATAGAPEGVQGQNGERKRVRADAGPASRAGVAQGDPTSERREGAANEGDDTHDAGNNSQRHAAHSGAVGGFWANAEWLYCTDGKYRPVEPGTLPVVDGLAGDLGLVRLTSHPDRPHEERVIYAPLIQKGKARKIRLKGYGNAIVAEQAAAFIRAFLETEGSVKS